MQQLREKLVEHVDYELLPSPAWKALHEWFRGGPAIERRVVNLDGVPEVEVRRSEWRALTARGGSGVGWGGVLRHGGEGDGLFTAGAHSPASPR